MKKILLIGANSFVGKRLAEYFKGEYELIGTYHTNKNKNLDNQIQFDITKKDNVKSVLKETKPEAIIITAAISSTGEAEDKIINVNVKGVSNIVSFVKEIGIKPKIIFFSSEQIFNGKKGPYLETDEPNPINIYGKSKLEAEKLIQTYDNHLILRFPLILGDKQPDDHENFISLILKSQKDFKVFKNVYRTFTYVEDIPRIIQTLIEKDQKGILNISGDEFLSFADMAELIEKEFKIPKHEVIVCEDPKIPKKLGLKNDLLMRVIDFNLTTFEDMLIKIKNKTKSKGGGA